MAPAGTWAPVGACLHHGRYLLSRHGLGRTVAKGRAQDVTAMGKGRHDGTTQQLLKQDGVTERQKHGAIERSYAGRHQEFIRLPNRGFTGYLMYVLHSLSRAASSISMAGRPVPLVRGYFLR